MMYRLFIRALGDLAVLLFAFFAIEGIIHLIQTIW